MPSASKHTLYLCGAGNPEGVRLALTVNRERQQWDRIVLLDDDSAKHGDQVLDVTIAGPFDMLQDADANRDEVVNLVARTTEKRAAARDVIDRYGVPFAGLCSPTVDTHGVKLPNDLTVYQNATLGANSSVGEGSVVFIGAIVGHGSCIGACCVLAPNAVVNARVQLGEGVYVGTNASVLPDLEIGAWATVGAGSVVMQNVPAGATVMTAPGEILNRPPMTQTVAPGLRGVGGRSERHRLPQRPIEVERAVAEIWEELLEMPTVGAEDSFFSLGGNSLLALRMRDRIRASIGFELAVTDVFQFPTVRALAQHIAGGNDASRTGSVRARARRALVARRRA